MGKVSRFILRAMNYPKWPVRLTVVRHGHSEQNATQDIKELGLEDLEAALERMKKIRDADIELTDLGLWQADQTGMYLAGTEPFDICFRSPYTRTKQTAEGIAARLSYNLPIFVDERLREKEFGVLHARTTEEIRNLFPHEYAAREREGKYWYRILGGENYPDVGQRLHSFFDKMVRDYGGARVLIVTHQVPYKMTRKMFDHLDEEGVLTLEDAPNCGMQEWHIRRNLKHPDGKMVMNYYNRIGYDMRNAPSHHKQ